MTNRPHGSQRACSTSQRQGCIAAEGEHHLVIHHEGHLHSVRVLLFLGVYLVCCLHDFAVVVLRKVCSARGEVQACSGVVLFVCMLNQPFQLLCFQ